MTPDLIAEQLSAGPCVVPGFIPPGLLAELRADLGSIYEAGGLRRAGIGQGNQKSIHDQVRRDDIHWLENHSSLPAQAKLMELLTDLRQAFNRKLYLGLNDFEGHYAIYPPGGFYRRHLDTFKKDDSRVVSLIVYLNEDWQQSHGGQLRIHTQDGAHTDIQPIGGTLVCFLSQETEHEVLPSNHVRKSFAGWYKR